MKTTLRSALRAAALAASLLVLPAAATAADSAAQLLARTGRVPVESAGPYVEIGTYRIQVAVKLGRAQTTLPDGTWLYENFSAENSAARGTLVVRFIAGRVSELYLATPAVVAALKKPSRADAGSLAVVTPDRR